jgi:recombinational DNA repair ATPase RecF
MSDTPQTDDLARGNHVVPTEFAQDLERERDEARAAFAIATDRCVEAQSNERAAQAKSDRAEKMLRTAATRADELAQALKAILFFCEEDQQFASKPYRAAFLHAQKLVTRHTSPVTSE